MTLTEDQRKRMEENRIRALQIKRKKELERGHMIKRDNNRNDVINDDIYSGGGFVRNEKTITNNNQSPQDLHEHSSATILSSSEKRNTVNIDDHASGTSSILMMNETNIIHGKRGDIQNDDDNESSSSSSSSSLEEFELNSSSYITQTEAQRMYCLPMGTLAVCSYIEKENPQKRGWSKMKLYHRKEVRRRARKRFGGKDGLIQERENRKRKRLEKDLKEANDIFCSGLGKK